MFYCADSYVKAAYVIGKIHAYIAFFVFMEGIFAGNG